MPPQPSGGVPQVMPSAAQVVFVQPQTFGVPPPPHVSVPEHEPQSMVPPQPSEIVLHCWALQVAGVQLVAQLPALQNWPWGQAVPHWMVPFALQPSG